MTAVAVAAVTVVRCARGGGDAGQDAVLDTLPDALPDAPLETDSRRNNPIEFTQ